MLDSSPATTNNNKKEHIIHLLCCVKVMIKIKHVKKTLQGGHDQLKKKGGGVFNFLFYPKLPRVNGLFPFCKHSKIRKTEVFSKEIERRIFQM